MSKKPRKTIRLVFKAFVSLWVLRYRRVLTRINAWVTRRLVAAYKKHIQIKELALNNRKTIVLQDLKISVEFRMCAGREMLRIGTAPFIAMLKSEAEGNEVQAKMEAEQFLHVSRLMLCECAIKPRIIRSRCVVNPGEISIDDCSDEEVSDASTQLYESSNVRYFGTPERKQDKSFSLADLQRMQETATLFDRTLSRYGGLDPENFLDSSMDNISTITSMMDTALSAHAEAIAKANFKKGKK
jgi:hypothetical protein